MAIIYSYPQATPTKTDLLIGTLLSDDSGENPTKSFTIADIIGLVPAAGTGGTVTSIGLTNTDGFLTIQNTPITTAGNIGINLYSSGGTPGATTFYRGDGQWAEPTGTATQTLYTIGSTANGPNIDITLQDSPSSAPTTVTLVPGNDINLTTTTNQITIASEAVGSISAGTFISVDATDPLIPIVDLSATGLGTPTSDYYLRGDNTWATIATGGTMSSWDLQADTGTDQNIVDGEDVKFIGGTGIDTSVADNAGVAELTIALDSTAVGSLTVAATTYDNTADALAVTATGNAYTINAKNVITPGVNPVASPTTSTVKNIVTLTAAQYAALSSTDANTLYFVV
jgi:hypothetical protein